jgi:hypothetical protein
MSETIATGPEAKAIAATAPKATRKPRTSEVIAAATDAGDHKAGETPTKAKRAKVTTKEAAKPKAKPRAKATKKARTNTWTDEAKKKYRAQIKAGKATYASIAKDLGITPQTVWAQLNRKKSA